MTDKLTKKSILAALSKVQEPELHKDLVTLNMIRNLEIAGDKVSFTVMLTTPACPLRGQIEKEAKQAVLSLGAKTVQVKLDSDVPNDGRMRGTRQHADPQRDRGWFGQRRSRQVNGRGKYRGGAGTKRHARRLDGCRYLWPKHSNHARRGKASAAKRQQTRSGGCL